MFSDIYRNSTEKTEKYVMDDGWAISELSKTENRIEILLLFLFSPIVEKWLIVSGPYCIISAYTQDYELKFTR